ncbi:protein FAM237B-like [Tachysurus fulvidraco]|uniref:protein FAM237B-like n=1 Tax=Tachysurus fulvidraco TaxID=1234273 RepID=UPI001FEFCFE8|nr:protein FAM237B-like [Tachysurus fulvidraco]
MKISTLDRIVGFSVRAVCALALATAACCFVSAPKAMLSTESLFGVDSAPPGGLAEIDSECWDTASHSLIEARKMRLDDGVAALWDFMARLRASPQTRHQELFMKLAQAFWGRYVDCVLSRAHGLGRRRSGV